MREPFTRYSPAISARRRKITKRCHSVASCVSPEALSRYRSLEASRILATASPLGRCLSSGSAPRWPVRITLFAMSFSFLTYVLSRLAADHPDTDKCDGRRDTARHQRDRSHIE